MYETFFQMDHTPFSRATPVADLYESPAMSDTLGRLAYAADRQLFAVVTADAGCGKSTLIRRFVTSLPKEEYLFLYLSDSKLTPRWFYKGMLDADHFLLLDAADDLHFLLELPLCVAPVKL